MGLFSFMKNAGAKLFKKKEAPVAAAAAPTMSEEQMDVQALTNAVNDLGIGISDMHLIMAKAVGVHGTCDTNADREKIILALGNVEGISTVEDYITVANPEPESKFYTVQKGDTLSKIAKTQYGDPMKYPVIFEANKPMLSHPDKIYPGQNLRIPQDVA
jgi:nucleoid-associated protein YgaU